MTKIRHKSVHTVTQRVASVYLFLIAVGYLFQTFSPLRINTDSYRLLSMAVSAYQGEGYLVDGHPDQFPEVYPFLVKILIQSGLARSMSLVILNLLCLFAVVAVFYIFCEDKKGSARTSLLVTFFLCSWISVKHVTLPLTDCVYSGISWLSLFCIWFFYRENGIRKWYWFAASVLLAYFAWQCRSIGITILPVIILTGLMHKDVCPYVTRMFAEKRYVVILGSALAALIAAMSLLPQTSWFESQFVRPGSYFQNLLAAVQNEGLSALFIRNIVFRVLEFGEVFCNLPQNKVPQLLPLIYGVGVIAWLVSLYGAFLLFRRKRHLPLVLYFFSYAAMMFLWPYYDARFWLPLLPFLAMLMFTAGEELESRWRIVLIVNRSYLVYFFLLGFIAIGFSTRISLAGKEFSELYGDGSSRDTYRYAFQNAKNVDMHKVNAGQLRLLGIFEPLAVRHSMQNEGQQLDTIDAQSASLSGGK